MHRNIATHGIALAGAWAFLAIYSPAQQFTGKETVSDLVDYPREITSADFNADGLLDILSASQSDRKIAWYPNLGGGGFGAQKVITLTASVAVSCLAADLNGDSLPDAVWTTPFSVGWSPNLGSGAFGAAQSLVTSTNNSELNATAADLDGDGDQDLIIAESWRMAWLENLGAGTFGPEIVFSNAVDWPEAVRTGDVDGDGDLDVLSASTWDNKFAWYENLGAGIMGPQSVISFLYKARDVICHDIDGDGRNDVIGAGADEICWYQNLGGGSFSQPHVISASAVSTFSISVADIDLDGDADLMASSTELGDLTWYENFGGAFGPDQFVTGGIASVYSAVLTDVDGDGDFDAIGVSTVVSHGELFWCANDQVPDSDPDDDGLSNTLEALWSTNPNQFDTDGDGLSDGLELGLINGTPFHTNGNVFVPDTDPLTTTNPLAADTDFGGVVDGIEDQNRDGAVNTWETDPNNGGDEALAFYVSNSSPGQRIHCQVFNALPRTAIVPAYSVRGPGPTALGIGISVDLTPPITALPPLLSGANGEAEWDGPTVPSSVPIGTNVWLQLVEMPLSSAAPRVSNSLLLPLGAN